MPMASRRMRFHKHSACSQKHYLSNSDSYPYQGYLFGHHATLNQTYHDLLWFYALNVGWGIFACIANIYGRFKLKNRDLTLPCLFGEPVQYALYWSCCIVTQKAWRCTNPLSHTQKLSSPSNINSPSSCSTPYTRARSAS